MPIAERVQFLDNDVRGENKKLTEEYNKVVEWLRESEESPSETLYRIESKEDYRFYSGRQDTDEVEADLLDQNRPNSTFNEVKPKIDMLIGLGAQVKYDGMVTPVGVEDEPLAELVNGTHIHFRKKVKLGKVELDCFEHTVKGGRSLLYFTIDMSNPLKPVVKPKRISGNNFTIDPASVEYDLSDAKYLFIWAWVDEDDIKKIDPNLDPHMLAMDRADVSGDPQYYDMLTGKYRIITCWYTSYELMYYFQNPLTGQVEKVTKANYLAFANALREGIQDPNTGQIIQTDQIPPAYRSYTKVYKYMTFSGIYVIDQGMSPFNEKVGFPAVLYGAYKDEDNNRWFGAVTAMKDPQRAVNTMRRQLVHLLQTLPKGLLLHELGAILDIEEYEKNSSKPNFHLELAKGGIEKVKFEKQPQISPVYQMLDEVMRKAMKDASGIQDDLMGIYTASREPGITVKTRQESALAVLFIVFNNYRESRLEGNRKFLYLLQQYVQGPEIVRIQGEKGMQLAQINSQINPQTGGFNDITIGEYDLEMEETVETGTFRAAIAQMLIEFNHNNPNSIPPDIILEYANIPFTVKTRVREYWQQMQELEQANKDADRAVEMAKVDAMRDRANNNNSKKEGK